MTNKTNYICALFSGTIGIFSRNIFEIEEMEYTNIK